jgi:hypothetical protein
MFEASRMPSGCGLLATIKDRCINYCRLSLRESTCFRREKGDNPTVISAPILRNSQPDGMRLANVSCVTARGIMTSPRMSHCSCGACSFFELIRNGRETSHRVVHEVSKRRRHMHISTTMFLREPCATVARANGRRRQTFVWTQWPAWYRHAMSSDLKMLSAPIPIHAPNKPPCQ